MSLVSPQMAKGFSRLFTLRSRINEYTVLKELGEGSYGIVKLCSFKGRLYAAKILDKSKLRRRREMVADEFGRMSLKDALQDVLREIAIMKKLTHTNVVKLVEVIDDEMNDELIMILDYCAKGQIMDWNEETQRFVCQFDCRPELDEGSIRRYFRDMVCGVEYLHSFKIVHRDIKPQNILVAEDGTVKIADFGVSDMFEKDDNLTVVTGTHEFWAPELLSEELEKYSGKAADIWALGLCLFALVYGTHPFIGESYLDTDDNIKEKPLELPPREISPELRDLLVRMLDKNPATRIKMWQILQHPWINVSDLPVLKRSTKSYIDITEVDIAHAVRPVSRFVQIKYVAMKWRRMLRERKKKREQLGAMLLNSSLK